MITCPFSYREDGLSLLPQVSQVIWSCWIRVRWRWSSSVTRGSQGWGPVSGGNTCPAHGAAASLTCVFFKCMLLILLLSF